ncbi:MFS transporter, partial [Pseudomonas sp. MWU12-2312b]
LNLSRNLGLITGASALGAVFVFASKAADITSASPEAVASGMRTTFATALALVVVALAVALVVKKR